MLILASNSPRRRQLLALGSWPFRTVPAEVDERQLPGEAPRSYVLRLAQAKASAAARTALPAGVVVAADTAVVDGTDILGKPADPADAARMLRRLSGRVHQVYTGLAALQLEDGALLSEWCVTDVRMRPYSEAEIQAYVATGDPLDKAGAYAIQHAGFEPVESLRGCYANVVGLPLCYLAQLLQRLGLDRMAAALAVCRGQDPDRCTVRQLGLG